MAAKAMIALRTTGASAAIAPKKARVDAHFGPVIQSIFAAMKNDGRTNLYRRQDGWHEHLQERVYEKIAINRAGLCAFM